MVNSKRYDPTITRFRKHTQQFVSNKTKKGHLSNEERDNEDVVKEEGILVKVDKNKIRSNGWEVKIDGKKYHCSYGDNILYLPPYRENGSYYIPSKECKVEVSLDKKSKIYTITKIKDANKKPIQMYQDKVKIQGAEGVSLILDKDGMEVSGEKLSVEGDVKIKTSKEDKSTPDEISVTDLYKRVQYLETKISDDNDS